MARLWDPFQRGPHVAVFGMNGSGKSTVIRYGLLPLRGSSRQVMIDVKDDQDSTWAGWGHRVYELPPAFTGKLRLVLNPDDPKPQLDRALTQIWNEGYCVVVVDESRTLTEREQMGKGSMIEKMITVGRGKGITMIVGAESTAYAVPSLRDQPAVVLVGQNRSEDQAKELAKIVGSKALAPVIAGIQGRQFLYTDNWSSPPIMGLTSLPVPAAPAA